MKIILLLLTMLAPLLRAADLVVGFRPAPPEFFTVEEAAKLPENGQADIGALLKARGYEMPDGSSAWFDAATAQIFLRSTPRDLNRLSLQLRDAQALTGSPDAVKQVKVTAVCHAIPLAAVPADFGPHSPLASLPADQLTVVDRCAIICRGGQRARSEQRDEARPAPVRGKKKPEPVDGQRDFEIEATVGDDGMTIDLNVAYSLTTRALASPDQRAVISLATQVIGMSGGSVMQELGISNEAVPRLILLTLHYQIKPPAGPGK